MKLRLGITTILLSTAAIIGLIHLGLNQTPSPNNAPNKAGDALTAPAPFPTAKKHPAKSAKIDTAPTPNTLTTQSKAYAELSPNDRALIENVASLEADKIDKELKDLTKEISQTDLYLQLEEGLLSPQQEIRAKAKLERFAILSLETKRRAYLDIEPELKDPFAAHANNLVEIRLALNEAD